MATVIQSRRSLAKQYAGTRFFCGCGCVFESDDDDDVTAEGDDLRCRCPEHSGWAFLPITTADAQIVRRKQRADQRVVR